MKLVLFSPRKYKLTLEAHLLLFRTAKSPNDMRDLSVVPIKGHPDHLLSTRGVTGWWQEDHPVGTQGHLRKRVLKGLVADFGFIFGVLR